MVRVQIDMAEELHKKAKTQAISEGVTLQEFLISLLKKEEVNRNAEDL